MQIAFILVGFLLTYVVSIGVFGKLVGLIIGVIGLGTLSWFMVQQASGVKKLALHHWLFVMVLWTGLLIAYAVAGLVVQRIIGKIY